MHQIYSGDYRKRWNDVNLTSVEIETSTVCNWNCRYCPVSSDPKPRKFMSMELFNQIIEKAAKHNTIEFVTLNSYNEPTIDPDFEERIKSLATTHLKLSLFTNGSALNEGKIKLLKETNIIRNITFNLPTLNENRFRELTGWKNVNLIRRNIECAINADLKVDLAVQGTEIDLAQNLQSIKQTYEPLIGSTIIPWGTGDRAGLVNNEFSKNILIKDKRLFGCRLLLHQLHVSVDGDCFICCEDYHQEEKFANIKDGDIKDIIANDKAVLLRKYVFGKEEAPADFICRRCIYMKQYKFNVNWKITGQFLP